jgi:hypothetical protein
MVKQNHKGWQELCEAAVAAKGSEELLQVVELLNAALEREERLRRNLPLLTTTETTEVSSNLAPSESHE